MSLIKCPECGKEISEKANVCINCGYPISEYVEELKKEKDKKKRLVLRLRKQIMQLKKHHFGNVGGF